MGLLGSPDGPSRTGCATNAPTGLADTARLGLGAVCGPPGAGSNLADGNGGTGGTLAADGSLRGRVLNPVLTILMDVVGQSVASCDSCGIADRARGLGCNGGSGGSLLGHLAQLRFLLALTAVVAQAGATLAVLLMLHCQ